MHNKIYYYHSLGNNFCTGTWKDRLYDKFLGRSLQLKSPSVLINTLDRFEIFTQSVGTVIVNLHILARNFDKFGCQLWIDNCENKYKYKQLIFNYKRQNSRSNRKFWEATFHIKKKYLI